MYKTQGIHTRSLGPPTWSFKAAPVWFLIFMALIPAAYLGILIAYALEASQMKGRALFGLLIIPYSLWTMNTMGRSQLLMYREGILLVRPRWFRLQETFISYDSIGEIASVWRKQTYFQIIVHLTDGSSEVFGFCLGKRNLFRFLSIVGKAMGKPAFDASTLEWYRNREQKWKTKT